VSGDRRRRAIILLPRHHRPGDPRHLVGDGDGHQPCWFALKQPVRPNADGGCLAPGVADDGGGAEDEEVAQVAISHLGDGSHALLATGRVLLGHEAEPGGELAARAEDSGIADGRGERGGGDEADPGYRLKALAGGRGAMLRHQIALLTVILADGINLGLTRMAETCQGATLRQLAHLHDWHISEADYGEALGRLIDVHRTVPLSALWGDGTTSSSDGQLFQAGAVPRSATSMRATATNPASASTPTSRTNMIRSQAA